MTGELPKPGSSRNTPRNWVSLVDTMEGHGLQAHALTSTALLVREGERMRHAVGGWTDWCAQGASRIFTLEQDGHPIATGEIRPDGRAG